MDIGKLIAYVLGEGFEPSVGGLAPTSDYKLAPLNQFR